MAKNRKVKKDYNYQSLRDERQYGFYWYSALWRVLRPILIVAAALIIVAGIGAKGWSWAYDNYLAPVDTQDTTEILFVVESGNSLTRVANNLETENLVHNSSVFKYYCDFLGMGQKIQAGEYKLTRAMAMTEIADQLTTGDGKPITRNITVIPGWTIEDMAEKFEKDGVIESKEAFLNACKTGDLFREYYYVEEVLKTPNVNQRKYVLEGYLSPNTYEVYTNATVQDILQKLLSQTEATFPAEYHDRATELGYTMDQMITLASIIEKEAKTKDFAKVSAVFHNRLNTNTPLGSDVTIHYVTGVRKMALSSEDLAVNSPYNTYARAGLPLGPICSPSPDAIKAALYPDEAFIAEKYMYFCSMDPDTGDLYFSKTLAEHEQAVEYYRPKWIEYDKSRGL